jgi:hypothetical protein
MGTRSLTKVFDGTLSMKTTKASNLLLNMYRQYDGYPLYHGNELADFLLSGVLVNGYSNNSIRQFNGMGCLALQLVTEMKDGVGGFYAYPIKLSLDAWQDYEYFVYSNGVRVYESQYVDWNTNLLFSGTWEQFKVFCNTPETDKQMLSTTMSVIMLDK